MEKSSSFWYKMFEDFSLAENQTDEIKWFNYGSKYVSQHISKHCKSS